jgi:two-component system nitrate/nitrite response regulator NarL
MPAPIRIAVIDDHPLFTSGLQLLLPEASAGRAQVVATGADAASAGDLVRRHQPDLALVDLHMPAPGGLRAITAIRRAAPRVRIVAISGDDNPEPALAALRAGAEAFLPKTAQARDIVQPLLSILDGWAVLPTDLLTTLLTHAHGIGSPPVTLTDAEHELLLMIAAGAGTTEITLRLHVSDRTAKRLTAALLRKLHVATRAEAAALAGRSGML